MTRKWKEEMDQVLLERYADEESAVLADELGCSVRTVQRMAARLGLRKSPDMLSRVGKKASDAATEWIRREKAAGKKIVKRYNGCGFEKGHKWDEETERRRLDAVKDGWAKRSERLRADKKPKGYLEKSSRMRKFAKNMRKDDLKKMSLEELEHLWKKKVDEVVMLRHEIDRRKGEGVELKNGMDVNFEEYVTK